MIAMIGKLQLPTKTIVTLIVGVQKEVVEHSMFLTLLLQELRISIGSRAAETMTSAEFYIHCLKAAREVLPDKVDPQEFTDLLNNLVDALFATESKFGEDIKAIYTLSSQAQADKRPSSQ